MTGSARASHPRLPPLVVVMGVAGSGKTTVGSALAERLGLDYVDVVPVSLVSSQLETLEPLQPDEAGSRLDLTAPVEEIVAEFIGTLPLTGD